MGEFTLAYVYVGSILGAGLIVGICLVLAANKISRTLLAIHAREISYAREVERKGPGDPP
jgi:hypothetical protein